MIGLSALGAFRKDLDFLETVPSISYENIFRMYATENTDSSNWELLSTGVTGDIDAGSY